MLVLRQNSSDRHGRRRPADRHGSTGQERKAPSAPQQSCAKHSEQDGQDNPSGDQTEDTESQARQKLNADPDPEERHAETQNSLRAHGDPRHAKTRAHTYGFTAPRLPRLRRSCFGSTRHGTGKSIAQGRDDERRGPQVKVSSMRASVL